MSAQKYMRLRGNNKKHAALRRLTNPVPLCQHQKPCCYVPTKETLLLRGSAKNLVVMCHHEKTLAALSQHKHTWCFVLARKTLLLCAAHITLQLCAGTEIHAAMPAQNPCCFVPIQNLPLLCGSKTKPCCCVQLKTTLLLCGGTKIQEHKKFCYYGTAASTGYTANLCSSKTAAALCLNNKRCYTTGVPQPKTVRLCATRKTHVVLCSSGNQPALCQHEKLCCPMPAHKYMPLHGSTKTMLLCAAHKTLLPCASTKGLATMCHHKKPCCSVEAPKILLWCAAAKNFVTTRQRKNTWCSVPPQKTLLFCAAQKTLLLCAGQKNTCCSVAAQNTLLLCESTENYATMGQHKNTCRYFGTRKKQ